LPADVGKVHEGERFGRYDQAGGY